MLSSLRTESPGDWSLLLVAYDIKEMYTNLGQTEIREAICATIQAAHSNTRSHYARVPYDKSVDPSFGKSTNYNDVAIFCLRMCWTLLILI